MTTAQVLQLVMNLGIIPGLFVWLLFDTRTEHKKAVEESRKREDALMIHINNSDQTQREITDAVKEISKNMLIMQRDIENLKDKVN